MYEKILLKLKQARGQNSNVSDRSLEDLAKTLEPVITTDEILEKMNLAAVITSFDGNINSYTAAAVKKAVEKKPVEKKLEEEEDSSKKKPEEGAEPAYVKKLFEQISNLTTELTAIKQGATTSSRLDKLKKSMEGLPDFYTKPIIAGFPRINFADDTEFDAYLTEIKTGGESFVQAAKENGLNTFAPGKDVKKVEETGETNSLSEARALVKKVQEDQKK